MIPPNIFFSKHQNKAEFKDLDNSEVLSSDFPVLRTSAVSMTSTASTTSIASMTSTVSFHQIFCWSWWLDHPWHPNDQIDLNGLCNLTGLNSLNSPISSKNFLIQMVWSSQHQNDQYWSLFVEWIIKNPIFYWYLVPSLSEAVEASLCNFLEFFLIKLKCWILGNMLTTMNVF